MFEFYLLILGVFSTGICAIWDLKTTEIPDWIPIITAIIAVIVYAFVSFKSGDWRPFFSSIEWGIIFLLIGAILYFSGQWGGGDSEILASIGFLTGGFKSFPLPFPFTYLFHLFLVGSFYMLGYSLYILWREKKVRNGVKNYFQKTNHNFIICMMALVAAFSLLLTPQFTPFFRIKFLLVTEISFLLIYSVWIVSKAVEDFGFKKRIPVSKLKVGDVLASSKKWVGITKEELRRIKKSGKKYVWIKEGVRFAPSFFLALLTSWFFGMWFF